MGGGGGGGGGGTAELHLVKEGEGDRADLLVT